MAQNDQDVHMRKIAEWSRILQSQPTDHEEDDPHQMPATQQYPTLQLASAAQPPVGPKVPTHHTPTMYAQPGNVSSYVRPAGTGGTSSSQPWASTTVIPDSQNCALMIMGLRKSCTVHALLSSIRGCGRVFSCSVMPRGGQSRTTGARLVFFECAAVERLLNQVAHGLFRVQGVVPSVSPHRTKAAPMPTSPYTRVLDIEGPASVVNQAGLSSLFSESFYWVDEVVLLTPLAGGWNRLEWRFSSYRLQSQNAYRCLSQQAGRAVAGQPWADVRVCYAADPCA